MSGLPPPPPPPPDLTPAPPLPTRMPAPPVRAPQSNTGRTIAIIVGGVVALIALAVVGFALTGHNSSSPTSSLPTPSPTAGSTASGSASADTSATPGATPSGNAAADFTSLANALYPTTEGGQRNTCYQGDNTFAQCPVTDRLRAALAAAVAKQQAGGADPICGCQNVDAGLSYTWQQHGASGGVLNISMFSGSDKLTYIVVAAPGGGFLVDDIDYCSAKPPSSVYGNAATSC